jgi:uncharacterized heparinase superfamily protein
MSRPALYLDTARRLKASQIAGRARRFVPPRLLAAGLRAARTASWSPVPRGLGASIAPQSGPTDPPHETGYLEAVGHRRRAGAPGFWQDESDGLLFLFHVHGFDALASFAAGPRTPAGDEFWIGLVRDWLTANDAIRGPGWHPYPTSVRVIAWAGSLPTLEEWPAELRARIAGEVARQGRYLTRCIEHDIGGNHVLKNATALCFAGSLVPQTGLLDRGLSLLRAELPKQLLADGGHVERSTAYHREIRHDLSEVAELLARGGRPIPDWLADCLRRATSWQEALVGPDMRLPLLNDAWDGPPEPSRNTEDRTVLAESGYAVLRHERDQLVFDAGPLTADHLPPHAHADALSLTLWWDGAPVLVDPGTFSYSGPPREEFRSTAAHNTVEVDGQDQCVFWGDFRLAFPPRVRGPVVVDVDGATVLLGSHDGYSRLASPACHQRAVVWLPGDGVICLDRLLSRSAHRVRSGLVAAPGVSVTPDRIGDLQLQPVGEAGAWRFETASYAPWLGTREVTARLVNEVSPAPGSIFGWSLLRSGVAVRLVDDAVVLDVAGRQRTIQIPWTAL